MSLATFAQSDEASSNPLQDDRFLLIETLGRGAMGVVYRAFDRTEQRLVALKVSTEPGRPGPGHPLAEEFAVASRLRHPHVVRALELGRARRGPFPADSVYLVLEHVQGVPVDHALRPGGVEGRRLLAVAAELLAALDYIHAQGFVHRDLKPANVLVARARGPRPDVRLTDFGLAAPLGVVRRIGQVSGSLPYVSPEAVLGKKQDARADLYSLGILLFQLGSGSLPVSRPGARALLEWHLVGPPADLAARRPDLPRELVELVRRLTAREPGQRPGSALEALALLGRPARPARAAGARVKATVSHRLRLALDAARLGALRCVRLPAAVDAADRLMSELQVWTQVRGVRFHTLPDAEDDLARLVLRLATELGGEGPRRTLKELALEHCLPLEWVGALPLLDTRRRPPSRPPADAPGRVVQFLLRCARERPLVLSVRSSFENELVRAVARELVEIASRGRGFFPGRGGLLVIVAARGERNRARTRAPRPPGAWPASTG